MRKVFAGAALALMLTAASVSSAEAKNPLYSPEGQSIPTPETPPEGSPKTADINILFVEGVGAAAAVVALVSRKKRHA